jgi:hypothetical protein
MTAHVPAPLAGRQQAPLLPVHRSCARRIVAAATRNADANPFRRNQDRSAANCAMKVIQNLRSGIHKVVEVGNKRRFAATFCE